MSQVIIFCDFDGTISKNDTVDTLCSIYADKKWIDIEKSWQKGEIGSKECLSGQVGCIDNLTESELQQFINDQPLQDGFKNFINRVRQENIDFYIVSDGFKSLIDRILANHGINNIKIFSNELCFDNGKLKAAFPFYNPNCEVDAGLCKCKVVKSLKNERTLIYIGDGRSDICASKHADILFAKGKLASYSSNQGIDFIPFDTFNDIEKYLVEEGIFDARDRSAI